jgi:uncharacterized protein (DUF433 family)
MGNQDFNFFEPNDPRVLPNYTVAEVAHYLFLSPAALRSWLGRSSGNGAHSRVKIELSKRTRHSALSFMNLVEAYVLDAVWQAFSVARGMVRMTLRQIQEEGALPSQRRPEIPNWLTVIRARTLADRNGERRVLEAYLCRIVSDEVGFPARLYLFTKKPSRELVSESPKLILIDPRLSFGRPVLAGTGIPTASIAERFKSGESIASLAEDYGRPPSEIETAIRFELPLEIA